MKVTLSTTAATAGRRRSAWTKPLALIAAIALPMLAMSAARADDVGCSTLPPNATLDRSVPTNIGLIQQQLVIYRCRNYMAEFAGVVWEARIWAARLAPQFDKAAVVFDIDETVLSNWESMYHNRFVYVPGGPCDLAAPAPCGQREWELSARAAALPPSLDFYRFVRTLRDKSGNPVDVLFVTGRGEDPAERAATERNLRREGYDTWVRLYMRPDSTRGDPVSTYKSNARKEIEQTHKIIVNIGDQYSDLIGEPSDDYAEKCFKLPNPFYFIPPGLPDGGLKCLQH